MAGLLLTVANNPTNTYLVQNGVANVVVKAEKAGGSWAGYDTSTIIWAVFGPREANPPSLTPQDANDLTLPHSFSPNRSGRYIIRASVRPSGVDENNNPHPFTHFTALYEVGSATGMNNPSAKESLEYDPTLGWARAVQEQLAIVQRVGSIGGRFLYVQNVHPTTTILKGCVCALAAVPNPDAGLAGPIWSDPHANGTWKEGKAGLMAWNNPYTHDTDSLDALEEFLVQVIPVSSNDAFVEYAPLFVATQAIAAGERGSVIMRGFVPASVGGNFGDPIYVGAQGVLTNATGGAYLRKVGIVGSGNSRRINPDGAGNPHATTGFVWFDGDSRISESVTFSSAQDNTVPVYSSGGNSVSWRTQDQIGIQQTGAAAEYLPKWADATGLELENSAIVSDANGNVGIGTTNPAGPLHVYTGDANIAPSALADELVVEGAGSTGISILTPNDQAGRLYFGDSDNAARAYVLYDHSVDIMKFSVASGNRLVINSSGNVGVGTEDPKARLHVDGSVINKVRVVTTSANILADDYIVAVNNTLAANVDLFLPPATADIVGQSFKIKDVSGTAPANNIQINRANATADQIDGSTPYVITAAYGSAEIVCLEAGRWIVL